MTKTQVEVITSVQRRRRWTRAEKERIVAAALQPGAVASEVARAAGIYTSQLFRWRRQLCKGGPQPPVFNPVAVVSEPGTMSPLVSSQRGGIIEIEFAAGCRMRITGSVPVPTLTALVKALSNGKRRR
jgi:transposase